jgi:hypothetical protein
MEHAPKADLGAERLRTGGNLRQGLSAGLKQQVIDGSVVLQRQRGQFLRQGEDHVKIADAEQFVRARGEPAVAGVGLALGAVPVATREEGDGTMAASGALIQMAAQRCRAAMLDGPEHLSQPRWDWFRPMKLSPAARMMSATSRVGRFLSSC